jgi:osmotically-inducible protein OsmY
MAHTSWSGDPGNRLAGHQRQDGRRRATLTGFVHSFAEKIAAEKATKSVCGVKFVANDIDVRAMTRTDPEIARDAVEAMLLDMRVPDDRF